MTQNKTSNRSAIFSHSSLSSLNFFLLIAQQIFRWAGSNKPFLVKSGLHSTQLAGLPEKRLPEVCNFLFYIISGEHIDNPQKEDFIITLGMDSSLEVLTVPTSKKLNNSITPADNETHSSPLSSLLYFCQTHTHTHTHTHASKLDHDKFKSKHYLAIGFTFWESSWL